MYLICSFYGFKNNIDIDIIADINNLCITKRTINSTKHTKNYNLFFIYTL